VRLSIQQGGNNGNLVVNVTDGAAIDTTGNLDPCIGVGNGTNDINVDGADLKCGEDSNSNDGVAAGKGNNTVDVTDSTIEAQDCIFVDSEDNTVAIVNVSGSTLTASEDCVETDTGDDTVNLTDVICFTGTEFGDGIELDNGNDTVNILRSEIICRADVTSCNAVEGNNGDDNITVVESTLRGPLDAIASQGEDDTITLGTGANLDGRIDCGSGFDTLIFAMDVPEETLPFFSAEIAAAGFPDGSVTINGLLYEWVNCELLINELVGVPTIRPIPTLSQWGLIAMAGVLWLIGFMVIRRRKVTA